MKRENLNIDTEFEINKVLIDALKENFRLKYDKDPYLFPGMSCSMIMNEKGELVAGFTQEENDAMKITERENILEQLEYQREQAKKRENLRKYISRLKLSLQDLVDLFPDNLSLKSEEKVYDDEDYDENYYD